MAEHLSETQKTLSLISRNKKIVTKHKMILALSDNTSRKHSLYRAKSRESCLRINRINLDSGVPHQSYSTGKALI